MARPTARVLALLEILQGGGTRTVADLAGRLGVDERTVRRYVAHLVDLDVPVRSVRGRYGGYRLAPGFRMPPLMLTDDEALAVLLGLVVGARQGLTPGTVAAVDSATAKVRRVLPELVRGRLDALLAALDVVGPARAVASPGSDVLLLLAEAVRDRRPLGITYTAADGTPSERTVHPYGVVARAGRWYLVGVDHLVGVEHLVGVDPGGDGVRSFRVDRIGSAVLRDGGFDVPAGFDAAAHVVDRIARAARRYEVSVLVEGTAEDVRARLPAGVVTVDEVADRPGVVRAVLQVEDLGWVPGALAALATPFVIEGPDALRPLVRALAERLVAASEGAPGGRL